MKAITIRQPWARAITGGWKTIENRGRPTAYRGLVAIHAGKTVDRAADRDPRIAHLYGPDASISAPLGAVLAVAELVDCHQMRWMSNSPTDTCCAPWGEPVHNDRPAYHLVLTNVRPLATPVPARGTLAVPFTLPDDVAAAVAAQLTEEARPC